MGILLIIVGGVFLMKNLGIVSSEAWGLVWPLSLVALGLFIVYKKHRWHMWKERVWRKLE